MKSEVALAGEALEVEGWSQGAMSGRGEAPPECTNVFTNYGARELSPAQKFVALPRSLRSDKPLSVRDSERIERRGKLS